jgi:hypothetical protein
MPRSIDLYRRRAQITNNPTNQISAATIGRIMAQPVDAAEISREYIENAINNLLKQIDDVTGLDLLGFAEILEGLVGDVPDLLAAFVALVGNLTLEIITKIVNAVLDAFGLSSEDGTVDEMIVALIAALQEIPVFVIPALGIVVTQIADLISGVGGAAISDVVALINLVQEIIDAIANALGHNGTGHTPAQVQTYLTTIPGGNIAGALNTAVTVAGTAIGTLLQHLNSSGQFDAAQLAGTLASAVSVAETQVSSALGGSSLGADVSNIVTDVTNAVTAPLATAETAVKTQLTNFFTGLYNAATGGNSTAAAASDVAAGVAAHSSNIIGIGATVAQLQQPAPSLGLVSAAINFANYPNAASLPSIFDTIIVSGTGTGAWEIANGQAVFAPAGTSTNTQFAIYNVFQTATDYQQMDLILSSDPESNTFNQIIGRSEDNPGFSPVNYVELALEGTAGSTTLTGVLSKVVAGTSAVIGSSFTVQYVPGAKYSLVCGMEIAGVLYPRYFQVLVNGVAQPIGSGGALYLSDASGTLSLIGSGHRFGGFGGSQYYASSVLYTPFPVSYFGIQDLVFPAGPPVSDSVSAPGTTTSTSYGAPSGTAAAVTVQIGSSGMAQVFNTAQIHTTAGGDFGYASWAVSGASTVAAVDAWAVMVDGTAPGQAGTPWLATGLTPGANTFTQEYRTTAGTATFSNCDLTVIPI